MKNFLIAWSFLLVIACGRSAEKGEHDTDVSDVSGESPNRALYDQVMDIHDEVMPKMDELFKFKTIIEEKVANTPGMLEDRKKELKSMALALDSANNAMMDWMHKFNPPSDSVDQEKTREYLEIEMETIKKVRDLTNETIEKAKAEINKP
ncbi:hypothetical protein BH10BAC4_BH10BAC4_15800 [soil metagenome]